MHGIKISSTTEAQDLSRLTNCLKAINLQVFIEITHVLIKYFTEIFLENFSADLFVSRTFNKFSIPPGKALRVNITENKRKFLK